ncbi:CBS domain-containing protein [Candidatus Woesearchaeota archaeon]|nr:CBS domain-containing protein [Candidatus Woesearchaeota archaeon]
MVFDITQLKRIRRQLELTQQQFAQLAGISQSMVAKIEAGRLDPTYSYVKKVEEAIALLAKRQDTEKHAKDIMHKSVISIRKNQKMTDVLPLFTKHGISQIPVVEDGKAMGLLSETAIVRHMQAGFTEKRVQEVMEEAPPVISAETSVMMIAALLQFSPLILVQVKGELVGVITKADLIKQLQRR